MRGLTAGFISRVPRRPSVSKSRLSWNSGAHVTTISEGIQLNPRPGWEVFKPQAAPAAAADPYQAGSGSGSRSSRGSPDVSHQAAHLRSYTEGFNLLYQPQQPLRGPGAPSRGGPSASLPRGSPPPPGGGRLGRESGGSDLDFSIPSPQSDSRPNSSPQVGAISKCGQVHTSTFRYLP